MRNFFKKNIQGEKKDIKEIWNRIKKRDFSGNTGLVVKNSVYQFSTAFVAKIGALIFTVILARLLMPELFGLYSLALSTILIFASFSDMGIGSALIKFVSGALGKNDKKKAKTYVAYLLKIKFLLVFISVSFLAISAKFIADTYYQKPLFLALIAGSLYILSISFIGFVENLFQASNKFKYPFFKELFFQITRLVLVPIAILISLNYSVSHEINLFLIILALVISYLLTFVFIFSFAKRKISFLKVKKEEINNNEKKRINKFILPLSITALSGMFFGYIDMIMLGRFVLAEFIGYYKVAFSLISSASVFIIFSAVLFPIFSRLKGKRLERALKKSVRITLILSFAGVIATLILASLVVEIIFGQDYSTAIPFLRIFSILLISGPLTALYGNYFISQGKPGTVAKLLIFSTVINIVLNYFLITWLLNYSQFMAVVGACIATLVSRYLYLGGLIIKRKKD